MSSREETYCVKEKQFTKNINPIIKISKNGNKYIQSTCLICGNKKVVFLKNLLMEKNLIMEKIMEKNLLINNINKNNKQTI